MIETLKKTGMRSSELSNLKVEDINLDKNRLYVRTEKGDKDRDLSIQTSLRGLQGS